MRPGLEEVKALGGAAGQATGPVAAMPGWAVTRRALEPWRPPQPPEQGQLRAQEKPPSAKSSGRPRGRAPVSARRCKRRRQGPASASAAARAPVYCQLTGQKRAAGLRGRAHCGDLNGEIQVPTPTTTQA